MADDKALELAREIITGCKDCDPKAGMNNNPECYDCSLTSPREYRLAEAYITLDAENAKLREGNEALGKRIDQVIDRRFEP